MAQMKGNTSDLLYGYIKQRLKKIDMESEKKNNVQQSAPNTTQTVYTFPTTNSMEIARNAPQAINQYNAQQESKKKREERKAANTIDTSKMSDEQIISKYESIPEYNVLARTFDSKKSDAYDQKQSMLSAYQNAKNGQIENFIIDNNISEIALANAKAYNDAAKPESFFKGGSIIPPVASSYHYENIKKLADASGIDIKDILAYKESVSVKSAKDKNVKYADEHPVIGTIVSVPTNILGSSVNLIDNAGNYISGKPIGSNQAVNAFSDAAGSMRNAVSENINNPVGKFAYNVGTSIADNVALMPLGTGLTLAGMASEAASGTLNEAKDRNLTPNQMMGTTIASGAIEAITEKIPLDNLFKIAKTQGRQSVKQILKNALKQAGTEASEEAVSELANTFVDNVINEDESVFNQSVNQYMIMYGLTRAQAENKAREDIAARTLQSALAGAASGGIMAGGASLYSRVGRSDVKKIDSVDNAYGLDPLNAVGLNENTSQKNISQIKERANNFLNTVMSNKGDSKLEHNQLQLSDVPDYIVSMVNAASNGKLDISGKKMAIEGSKLYHEINNHSNAEIEASRGQIPLNRSDISNIIDTMYNPDYVEYVSNGLATNQREAFALIKADGGYIVLVENVGGKRNPNIVPEQIIHFTDKKMDRFLNGEVSIADIIYENRARKGTAESNVEDIKNRVTAAQLAQGASAHTSETSQRSPLFNNSIPNSVENVNEDAQNVQYNGKKIDGFDDLNKDLDRLIGMYKGNENTQNLYEQMKSALNEYVQTYNQDAIDRALTLASDIDGTLVGHSYTRKGSGKNSSKSQNNRVTTDFAEGEFVDTLLAYGKSLRNTARSNAESTSQNSVEIPFSSQHSYSEITEQSEENVNAGQRSYTSRTALNSFLNSEMVKRAKQNLEVFQKEIDNEKFNVDRVSESQSIEKAAENISKDYESVVSRLKNTDTLHSGVETDEAMMILDKMLSDAEHTGDYANVLDWAKMVVNKAHNVGQALQAFAKYSRTPEGTIIKAQQIINAQAEAFYNNNPNVRNDMQKTTEQLWEELENAQSNIDKMMPLEQDGNYKSVDVEGIVRKVLQENRFIRKMDDNSINNVADYISKQIRRGADHNQISEDIQNYAATGLFGLDETDVQTVMDILGKAETMPDSKERYDLEQTAIDILADKVCNTSFMDKLNSWRYLSMLGNIRTHIRNVLGNNLNSMTTGVKNNVAAVLEAVYQKSGGKIDRTKTVLNPVSDKSLIDAGRNDAMTNVYSILKDGGSNYSNMLNRIESSKTIYQIKFLESVRKLNNNALEVEDFIGLKNKYATSIAGYLKANGRDASIFDSKEKADIDFLNEAREYAIEEAKKATFHEYSAFASWLSKTSNSLKNSSNPIAKLGHVMIEGNAAFKKTPANILKQGFEYATGPIEMVKGVYQLCNSVKKGKYTASQAIDTFSKGMTGSAIMGLGAFLASMGLITGSSSDDKKDSKFDDLTGGQNYALKIGDKSYTIDWLAPFALPLFVGVGLQNNFSSTGKGSVGDVLSDIAAPMLEMTMLDGLSSTLERVRYSDDAWDAAKSIVSTSVANYANQLFPTVVGHFARSIDSTRRTTTPDREGVAGDIEYAVNKIKNKIPFLSMTNEPYVDAWGNTEENTGGNLFGRLAYNMLSPGYYSEQSYDEVENYLSELRKDTDNSNVFPSNAERSVYTEDGKIKLSGSDYTKYAKEKGNLQHSVLSSIFASKDYEKLTDDQKVELVNSAYSASGKISQSSIGYNPKDMTMPELYEEIGADGIAKYLIIKQKSSEDDISEYDAIESSDLSSDEKGYFIDKMLKPSESKVSALKKHNDVMKKYGYEGIYTYYTIKSRVDENDTSNAAKVSAVDSVNISDEDKGYYLSKILDVSNAASAIQRTYGDEGLYKWYSMHSKVDKDSDMPYQIVKSGMPYEDMLNYASVLYEDGKKKTAREKAADAIRKAQDNISYYKVVERVNEILGGKTDEEKAAEKESKIQNKVSNIYGGSSNYYEIANRVNEILDGNSSKNNTSYESVSERVNQILDRNSKKKQSYDDVVNRVNAILDKNKAFSLTTLN